MSATEIKVHTSWLNLRKDTDKVSAFHGRKPADVRAILALAAGTGHRQWRVAMVCCKVLGKAESHQAKALPSLYEALRHSERSVRSAAAEALGNLAPSGLVSARQLWNSLITENDPLTAYQMAGSLTATLPSDFTKEQSRTLLSFLQSGFQKSGATLPLGGGRGKTILEPGRGESELHDILGIYSHLLGALGKSPGLAQERFDFLLSTLDTWVLSRHYNGQRVRALLPLVESDEEKERLLEAAGRSSGQYALRGPEFYLLELRPEWAPHIIRNRLSRSCPWDWSNWTHSLARLSPQHLADVVSLLDEFEGEPRNILFKLLGESKVEYQLEGLEACLESGDETLIKATLERLKKYRQPLRQFLDKLSQLKQTSENSEIRDLCDAVIGQSGGLPGQEGEVPNGTAPDFQLEILLEETYRTPFGPEQKPWEVSLRLFSVHCSANQVVFLTPTRLHCFEIDESFQVTSKSEILLPVKEGFLTVSFYRPGVGSDLFFSSTRASSTTIYLLRDGRLRAFKREIGSDHVPRAHHDLLWNGTSYGWDYQAWIMSHFEADPGHHERSAYTLDPHSGKVEQRLAGGGEWDTVRRPCLSAHFGTTFRMEARRELEFCYALDGRFRRSNFRDLLLPSEDANPIDSGTDYDDSSALLMDVFSDRRLRVSVWRNLRGSGSNP